MVAVRSVEDFAKRNEGDLRRMMNFKTGIFDKNLVDEAIQEFYLKLMETRALETFDEKEGAFNTYISNLFFWSLPIIRRNNFRINFDVLSSVSVSDNNRCKNVDVWDFVSTKSPRSTEFLPKKPLSKRTEEEKDSSAHNSLGISFNVDGRFNCSALDSAQEESFCRDLEDFKRYLKRTEPKNKYKRMETYLDKKLEGCLNTDIAVILKVSTTMVRLIREDCKKKYNKWKSCHEQD